MPDLRPNWTMPEMANCRDCGNAYRLVGEQGLCPRCLLQVVHWAPNPLLAAEMAEPEHQFPRVPMPPLQPWQVTLIQAMFPGQEREVLEVIGYTTLPDDEDSEPEWIPVTGYEGMYEISHRSGRLRTNPGVEPAQPLVYAEHGWVPEDQILEGSDMTDQLSCAAEAISEAGRAMDRMNRMSERAAAALREMEQGIVQRANPAMRFENVQQVALTSPPNPEQRVMDEIDQLVDEGLAVGPYHDDYSRDWHDRSGDVLCGLCNREWHGLASKGGCPGEFATDEEIEAYRTKKQDHRRTMKGYTLDDVRRLRGMGEAATNERHARAAQRLLDPRTPRRTLHVRLWTRDTETGRMSLLETGLDVLEISWDRSGLIVTGRLRDPISQWSFVNDEDMVHPEGIYHAETNTWQQAVRLPIHMPESGHTMLEALVPDDPTSGFHHIGHIADGDLQIASERNRILEWGGREPVRSIAQEPFNATMRFTGDADHTVWNRLLRGG